MVHRSYCHRLPLICYVTWLFLEGSHCGKPHFETRLESDHSSLSFNSFHHRLDLLTNDLQKDLKGDKPTVNEVDEKGYYNDQTNVRRAWSNEKIMQEHQDKLNLHYVKLASQNAENVMQTGKCKLPTRRCLDVQKMRRDTKTYWPSCALIHTCGHDSGCCANTDHSCSPIESKLVDLYFFSFDFAVHTKKRGRVERLTFENHTECACRPTSMAALLEARDQVAESLFRKTPKTCHCPKHFTPEIGLGDECSCACKNENSKKCIRIKKGKRSYNLKNCRKKGQCGVPSCDYGSFKKDFGRCPRKNERDKKGLAG